MASYYTIFHPIQNTVLVLLKTCSLYLQLPIPIRRQPYPEPDEVPRKYRRKLFDNYGEIGLKYLYHRTC